MLEAALRGKIAHDFEAEDALTSVIFGGLRYLPTMVLTEWLAGARGTSGETADFFADAEPMDIELWPRWPDVLRPGRHVEPDAVVRVGSRICIVEAKLRSGKSQAFLDPEAGSPDEAPGEAIPELADQLAREYLSGVDWYRHRGAPAENISLVYVTAHVALPRDELAESLAQIGSVNARLFWTSWGDLSSLLMSRSFPTAGQSAVASDMLAYLRELNLIRFSGWQLRTLCGRPWRYAAGEDATYFGSVGVTDARALWRYEMQSFRYFAGATTEPTFSWRYWGRDS